MIKPYYEEPGITIYCADCRDVLPQLEPVDLVLTDPPYGIGVDLAMHKKSGSQYGKSAAPAGKYEYSNWDKCAPENALIENIIDMGKKTILWGGNYFYLPPARCILVWDKQTDNGNNCFTDCELAWTNLDKPIRIKHHMWNGMLRKNNEPRYGHPTQKPLEIIKWCIFISGTTGTILDPFMGSGTTLRAAKDLGRRAIGIEIEQKYCDIAIERLRQGVLL